MDQAGIGMQVLSAVTPGAQNLPGADGVAYGGKLNSRVANEVIPVYPDRFRAFATLPISQPEAAADELERSVREHGFAAEGSPSDSEIWPSITSNAGWPWPGGRVQVSARALSTTSCRTVLRSRLALTRSTAALSRERRSRSISFSCRSSSGFFKVARSCRTASSRVLSQQS